MPSARTLAVFPSDRICAKRRAALNFSARTSRRTRGPFVNVVLNNIDVTPRLFVHPMDGVFSLEFFPSIGPRGVAMDRAILANQSGARRIGLKLIVHVQAGLHGTVEARRRNESLPGTMGPCFRLPCARACLVDDERDGSEAGRIRSNGPAVVGPRGPALHLRLWRGPRRQWFARPHRGGAAAGRVGQSELLPRAGGSQLQHPGWERTELVQIRELEFEETRAVSLRTPIGESREQRTRPH